MILYHYCCAHSAADIERDGLIKPTWVTWEHLDQLLLRDGWHPSRLGAAPTVAWLTDMAEPEPLALGLIQREGICDRLEVRFTVDVMDALPWATFALRHRANPAWRLQLEHGREPSRWFVLTRPTAPIARLDLVRDPGGERP